MKMPANTARRRPERSGEYAENACHGDGAAAERRHAGRSSGRRACRGGSERGAYAAPRTSSWRAPVCCACIQSAICCALLEAVKMARESERSTSSQEAM